MATSFSSYAGPIPSISVSLAITLLLFISQCARGRRNADSVRTLTIRQTVGMLRASHAAVSGNPARDPGLRNRSRSCDEPVCRSHAGTC